MTVHIHAHIYTHRLLLAPRLLNSSARLGLLQRRQPVRHCREGPAAAGLRRGNEAAVDDAAGWRHEGRNGLRNAERSTAKRRNANIE